jgi:hypothetical protein
MHEYELNLSPSICRLAHGKRGGGSNQTASFCRL